MSYKELEPVIMGGHAGSRDKTNFVAHEITVPKAEINESIYEHPAKFLGVITRDEESIAFIGDKDYCQAMMTKAKRMVVEETRRRAAEKAKSGAGEGNGIMYSLHRIGGYLELVGT